MSYNFCLGRGGKLHQSSALHLPDFIIALEALEDPKANASIGTTIRTASSIKRDQLLKSGSTFLSSSSETSFNERKGKISIKKMTYYGKLVLFEEELPPIEPKGEALSELIMENWPWPFTNDEELRVYHRRLEVLERADNIEHALPFFKGDMFELFIESLASEMSFAQLEKASLKELIEDQLTPQDLYTLDQEAPLEIALGNKKSFTVRYEEEGPKIAARIQDLYSVTKHPKLPRRGKLKVELLSPANRVAQVTNDLPNFWNTSWQQVRKDLKQSIPNIFGQRTLRPLPL